MQALLAFLAGQTLCAGLAALASRTRRSALSRVAHETWHAAFARQSLLASRPGLSAFTGQSLRTGKSRETVLADDAWRTLFAALTLQATQTVLAAETLRSGWPDIAGRAHATNQTALARHALQSAWSALASSAGLAFLADLTAQTLRARQTFARPAALALRSGRSYFTGRTIATIAKFFNSRAHCIDHCLDRNADGLFQAGPQCNDFGAEIGDCARRLRFDQRTFPRPLMALLVEHLAEG
jgi:hypothetical protein